MALGWGEKEELVRWAEAQVSEKENRGRRASWESMEGSPW